MPKNYSQKEFEKDLTELENLIKENNKKNMKGGKKSKKEEEEEEMEEEEEEMKGGKVEEDDKTRKFTVCQLNGKDLTDEIGHVEIKVGRTPLNAAKKLLKSIAKHMKLKGNARHSLKATFMIRESTRGSKKHDKMYGPYHGRYHKYTPEEAKKASIKKADGTLQKFGLKPIVKLAKHGKMNHQKGGK
jgi:hypothetical protein